MKIFWKSLAALLFLALGVWAIGSEGPDAAATPLAALTAAAGDPSWRSSPVWDDGNAELCTYTVRWPRSGHGLTGRAMLVLVKEPWNPERGTKADTPHPHGFDVLKLNHIRDVPTGLSTYHQMASVFTRRDSGALVKLAATSSEAWGIATAEVNGGRLATRSYFEDEGNSEAPFPPGALPEDGLPATLRGFVAGPLPDSLAVFPSLLTSKNAGLAASTWRLERFETVAASPEGRLPAVALRLSIGKDSRVYTFDKAPTHRLLRFEGSDGTLYEMARCARIPHGKMDEPGDESWPAEVQG